MSRVFKYEPFMFDSDSVGTELLIYPFEMDFPHGVNNDEWTTEDGITYKVTEMTPSHIRNCMRMIERSRIKDSFYHVLEKELKRRDEIALNKLKDKNEIEELPF